MWSELKIFEFMTDGGGRDENDCGSGHGGVDVPREAERPSMLYSVGSPREHTIHQAIRIGW